MASNSASTKKRAVYHDMRIDDIRILFPHITTKNIYKGEDRGYGLTCILDPKNPHHAEVITQLRQISSKAYNTIKATLSLPEQKSLQEYEVIKEEYDKNTDSLTGNYLVKVLTHSLPKLYINGVSVQQSDYEPVGNGSIADVAISFKESHLPQLKSAGIIAYLNAINTKVISSKGSTKYFDPFAQDNDATNDACPF